MKKLLFTNLGVILLSAFFVLMYSCNKEEENKPPTISSVVVNPATVDANGVATVSVTATDPDGDALTYTYVVSGGSITVNGASATWTASEQEGAYSVTVTVTDGKGGQASSSASLTVLPAPTVLNITITQHPEGGNDVNKVSVEYEGIVSGTIEPISVTVQWWWEDGNHENPNMMNSEETVFNSNNVTTKTTLYSAPVGYVLLNYYWVKLIWTDDTGSHELSSSKAYCTHNKSSHKNKLIRITKHN